jgi:hypothetical protein
VKVGPGKSILDEAGAEEKSSDQYVEGKARKRRDDGLECGISLLFWTMFKVGNPRLGLSSPAPRAGAPFQRSLRHVAGKELIDGLKKIFSISEDQHWLAHRGPRVRLPRGDIGGNLRRMNNFGI